LQLRDKSEQLLTTSMQRVVSSTMMCVVGRSPNFFHHGKRPL
jgi:hypothetical protein